MFVVIKSAANASVMAAVTVLLLAVSTNEVGAQSNPVEIVKERKAYMKGFGRNFGPIIAVMKGRQTDLTDATAAAERLNREAKRLVAQFPAGTGRDVVPETRSKPEVWSQRAEFEAAAELMVVETGKLAAAGRANDLAAFKARFRPFAKSCGGCHSGKKDRGGKFRYPNE